MLEELGCEVAGSFGSVVDAVEAAETLAIDAAVVDMILNGARAYAVAAALEARSIPFGFATGSIDERANERWAGRPFISKPYSKGEVEVLLLSLLPTERPAT
jgi:CheY-like chemotaxis protein